VSDGLQSLPRADELAVIINVQTKYVSTLALLSTLRHINIPTVMVDCESADGSFEWFQSLQRSHSFYLLRRSRQPHGKVLDWLFLGVQADRILLVDSDMEILNDAMFKSMLQHTCNEHIYGSGYLQQGTWLETHYGTNYDLSPGIGLYKTRPWIPFVLLRTELMRSAVAAGASFMHRMVANDVPQLPIISRLLWQRFHFSWFRRNRLRGLDRFRHIYEGVSPSYVFFDTGAQIHETLCHRGFSFTDVGPAVPYWSIHHLQGVTRDLIQGPSHDARSAVSVEPMITDKLKAYGIQINNG
jgi:hypothetical protein